MSKFPPNLTIKQWNRDDRPREKLRDKGPESLSVAELLAIVIGSGSRGESAVDLMKRIIRHQKNGLMDLQRVSLKDLTQFKGMVLSRP